MDGDMTARILYLSLLVAAVGGWAMAEYRGKLGAGLRTLMAWGMIIVGLMAGYGLWTDMRSSILPVQQVEGQSIHIPRAADGHFYLTLEIEGRSIPFMVDTGATNIVLSARDAARLGVTTEGLVYMGEANTANGTVRTARVWLKDVQLGPFHDDSVTAYVTDGAMDGSLLGMDYLRRYRMEIDGDQMILSR